MNLFSLSKSFLTKSAGKVDDLKSKYPQHSKIIDVLEKTDPTPNKKYLEWMLKQVNDGFNILDITPSIKYFHNNINSFKEKDINFYNSKSLENQIKEIESQKEHKILEKGISEKVYKDGRFVVIRPDDKNACIRYGKGTKWCITEKNTDHYEEYSSANMIFYFIIDTVAENKSVMGKIAYAIYRDNENQILNYEIFDAQDNVITDEDVKNYMGEEEFNKALNIIKTDAPKQKKTKEYDEDRVLENMALLEKDLGKIKKMMVEYSDLETIIASNINIDQEMKLKFLKDTDSYIRYHLAKNSAIDKEMQLILANDSVKNVRAGLAKNPSIDEEIQLILANDEYSNVREHLADNRMIVEDVQLILAKDTKPWVTIGLAANKSITKKVQLILAKNNDKYVRQNLLDNPSLDEKIREFLESQSLAK